MATVGLLHPGEMGAAVGGCLVSVGHEVLWDPAGRSRASTGRALAAELTGVTFDRLIERSSVILSICPPHAALDVAAQVAATGYAGIYVDANAISVATAEQVSGIVTAAGATYVDGGIIGHAARDRRPHQALPVRPARQRGPCPVRPVGARRADRRRPALRRVGGEDGLRRLDQGQLGAAAGRPDPRPGRRRGAHAAGRVGAVPAALAERSEGAASAAAAKGWRWVAEMEEIAASMSAAGLPAGFHEAAAEIYDRASQAAGTPTSRRPHPNPPPPPWTRSSQASCNPPSA